THASSQGKGYHCPMHPQVHADSPGTCPICGMDLVPDQALPSPPSNEPSTPSTAPGLNPSPGNTPPGTAPIDLSLDRIQAIGVRTALVQESTTSEHVRAVAVILPTEQGTAEVHVRTPGFVEQIFVTQTGVSVKRGTPLLAIYSPEIFQAQGE